MEDNQLNRMQQLVDQLNQASDAYYNGRGELMTDYEWDARFDELKQLEQQTGTVLPNSPTNNVSADNITGQKEPHEYPALSLAKTKKVADMAKWAEGRPIWLSWKLDGLTLVVTYDEGKLSKVVTRGDGHIGTNITHLAPAIDGIPQHLPLKGHLVVRGEAVISYDDFERFNMESDEEYANPRNLASGSLTLKDVNEVSLRHIHWIPFTLVHIDEEIKSWGERMDTLEKAGLHCVDREYIASPTMDSLQAVIDRWTEKVTSRKNPYPVDGLVITYDDTSYAQTGSVTGHHATRASLCNISECERLGIGGKGSIIDIIKANKIIPKVIRVEESHGVFAPPQSCPVCGAPTVVRVSEASGTKTLHCTNDACPAKQLKKFARLVSKEAINIDGLSEQTLQKFINLGWVNEPANLFHLDTHAIELAGMDGFGRKSVANLLSAVRKARTVEARRFLFALNIPLCGMDVCTRLLSAFKLEDLFATARSTADEQVFSAIDGIGPEKSRSFVAWVKDDRNFEAVTNLMKELTITQPDLTAKGDKCKGLTFVVTGDVHHYKNRNELKAYIESQGGKVTGSVSKSTNYLINNDAASTSSKNQKAHQLNIPIITEDDFIKQFG